MLVRTTPRSLFFKTPLQSATRNFRMSLTSETKNVLKSTPALVNKSLLQNFSESINYVAKTKEQLRVVYPNVELSSLPAGTKMLAFASGMDKSGHYNYAVPVTTNYDVENIVKFLNDYDRWPQLLIEKVAKQDIVAYKVGQDRNYIDSRRSGPFKMLGRELQDQIEAAYESQRLPVVIDDKSKRCTFAEFTALTTTDPDLKNVLGFLKEQHKRPQLPAVAAKEDDIPAISNRI